MLSNANFVALERRLWAEGNPLCDELVSTRDELLFLLSHAKKVMEKYSVAISTTASIDDLDFFKEWDEFGDAIDNLTYDMGE